MREEQQQLLRIIGQLPARLLSEQVAAVLNCQPHDVPILVAARLLKPLGNPPPCSVKYFAALEVLELTKERTWLAKVTNVLNQHWQKKTPPSGKCRAEYLPAGQPLPAARPALWPGINLLKRDYGEALFVQCLPVPNIHAAASTFSAAFRSYSSSDGNFIRARFA